MLRSIRQAAAAATGAAPVPEPEPEGAAVAVEPVGVAGAGKAAAGAADKDKDMQLQALVYQLLYALKHKIDVDGGAQQVAAPHAQEDTPGPAKPVAVKKPQAAQLKPQARQQSAGGASGGGARPKMEPSRRSRNGSADSKDGQDSPGDALWSATMEDVQHDPELLDELAHLDTVTPAELMRQLEAANAELTKTKADLAKAQDTIRQHEHHLAQTRAACDSAKSMLLSMVAAQKEAKAKETAASAERQAKLQQSIEAGAAIIDDARKWAVAHPQAGDIRGLLAGILQWYLTLRQASDEPAK